MRELLARQSVDWSEVEQWGILGEVSGLGSCRTRQGNKLEFGGVLIELDSDKSGIGLELDVVIVCTLEEGELLSVTMRAQVRVFILCRCAVPESSFQRCWLIQAVCTGGQGHSFAA
jgi:hypothetical protein